MTRTTTFTAGYLICLLLGLADLGAVAAINSDAAPPATVVILGGVFGLVTLAAALPAWRGLRFGVPAIVVSRVLSALLAIPAFFADAPAWARMIAATSIVLTVAGVGMLVGAVRSRALAR